MEERTKSKFETVLITGASGGIGLELARLFAKEGYNLLLVSRDKKTLTDVAIQIRGDYKVSVGVIALDLSLENSGVDLYNLVKKNNQKVSILINNAGYGGVGSHTDRKHDDEHGMINCNVQSLVSLTRLFGADMIANKSGKILNVASVAGFVPGPYQSVYFATKAFVISYSVGLSREFANSGVTISCLCPGATATKFAERAGFDVKNRMFKGAMSADAVAHAGYDGLMAGKHLIVPGFLNKASIFAIRFIPSHIAARVVARIQAPKIKN
jgi:short-subunit dehydrogenase